MTYFWFSKIIKLKNLGKFSYTTKSKLENQVEKLHNLEEG